MGQMNIKVLNENYTMEEGATFLDLAKKVQDKFEYTIALAKYAGKLQELNKKIPGEGEVGFITLNEEDGRRAYRRSVTMLMNRSLYHVNKDLHVRIMYAFNHGFYCEAEEKFEFTKDFLDKVDADMRKAVSKSWTIWPNETRCRNLCSWTNNVSTTILLNSIIKELYLLNNLCI